jgi:hypothetical protein
MTKSVMFFHEALQSYLLAVQQITPVFGYMVSIVYMKNGFGQIHLCAGLNSVSYSLMKICVVL